MLLKAVLIAFTCSSFILGFNIDPRTKRQAIGAFGQIAGGFEANVRDIPSKPTVPEVFKSPGNPNKSVGAQQVPSTTAPLDVEDAPISPESSDEPDGPGSLSTAEASYTSDAPSAQSTNEEYGTSNSMLAQGSAEQLEPAFISGLPKIPGIPNGLNPIKGVNGGIGKGITKGISDGITGVVKAVGNGFTQVVGGVADRFQNAINKTYNEGENSVKDSFNSVKDLIHQKIETGANLTKTAFDLGTMGPKFVKNLVVN